MRRLGNLAFTLLGEHCRMTPSRTIANLEVDLAALRAAADRAGTALACLFSCSDEFEAEVVRVRREQGAYRARKRARHPLRWAALVGLLVTAFVLF
jgi:hypothetical protein